MKIEMESEAYAALELISAGSDEHVHYDTFQNFLFVSFMILYRNNSFLFFIYLKAPYRSQNYRNLKICTPEDVSTISEEANALIVSESEITIRTGKYKTDK